MNHDDEYKASEPHDAEILTHLITKRDILERLGRRRTGGPTRSTGPRLIRAAARQRLRPEPRLRRSDRHPYRFDGRADRRAIDRHRSDPANGPRYPRSARTDVVSAPARPTRHTGALEGPRSVASSLRPRDQVGDRGVDPQTDPRRRDAPATAHKDPPPRRDARSETRPEGVRRQACEARPRDRRRRRDR
jgi:hypothetical protein